MVAAQPVELGELGPAVGVVGERAGDVVPLGDGRGQVPLRRGEPGESLGGGLEATASSAAPTVAGVGLLALPLALGEHAQVVVGLGEASGPPGGPPRTAARAPRRRGARTWPAPRRPWSRPRRGASPGRWARTGPALPSSRGPPSARRRPGRREPSRPGRWWRRRWRAARRAAAGETTRGDEGHGAHWRTSSGSASAAGFWSGWRRGHDLGRRAHRPAAGRARRSLASSWRAGSRTPAGSRATTGRPGGSPALAPLSTTPGTAGCTWVTQLRREAARARPCPRVGHAPRAAAGTAPAGRWCAAPARLLVAQSLRMASSRLLVTAAAKWSAAFSRMGWACCSSWFFSSSCASGGSDLEHRRVGHRVRHVLVGQADLPERADGRLGRAERHHVGVEAVDLVQRLALLLDAVAELLHRIAALAPAAASAGRSTGTAPRSWRTAARATASLAGGLERVLLPPVELVVVVEHHLLGAGHGPAGSSASAPGSGGCGPAAARNLFGSRSWSRARCSRKATALPYWFMRSCRSAMERATVSESLAVGHSSR